MWSEKCLPHPKFFRSLRNSYCQKQKKLPNQDGIFPHGGFPDGILPASIKAVITRTGKSAIKIKLLYEWSEKCHLNKAIRDVLKMVRQTHTIVVKYRNRYDRQIILIKSIFPVLFKQFAYLFANIASEQDTFYFLSNPIDHVSSMFFISLPTILRQKSSSSKLLLNIMLIVTFTNF